MLDGGDDYESDQVFMKVIFFQKQKLVLMRSLRERWERMRKVRLVERGRGGDFSPGLVRMGEPARYFIIVFWCFCRVTDRRSIKLHLLKRSDCWREGGGGGGGEKGEGREAKWEGVIKERWLFSSVYRPKKFRRKYLKEQDYFELSPVVTMRWPRGEREFPFPVIPWNTSLKFPFPWHFVISLPIPPGKETFGRELGRESLFAVLRMAGQGIKMNKILNLTLLFIWFPVLRASNFPFLPFS